MTEPHEPPPLQDDCEIVISRLLKAPCALVWKAWTEPKHIARWWGPWEFTTRVIEQDLRPGGRSHYVLVGPDGSEYPVTGIFREVVLQERIVTTDEFAEGFAHPTIDDLPTGIVMTCLFEDLGEMTRLTLRIRHPSAEERRKHEAMGVINGWHSSFDCLEAYLPSLSGSEGPQTVSSEPGQDRLVLTRVLAAPPAMVWRAWTEGQHLRQWCCPTDFMVTHADTELVLGGRWRITMRSPDGTDLTCGGEYRAIVEPKQLVFTHAWSDPAGALGHMSEVTVLLSAQGDETLMRFEQVRFRSPESRNGHAQGWQEAFVNLANHLASQTAQA